MNPGALMMLKRRAMRKAGGTVTLAAALPVRTHKRDLAKRPGVWREFEMAAHHIEVEQPKRATWEWAPLPRIGSGRLSSPDETRIGNAESMREACNQDHGALDPDRIHCMITAREIQA
jgi:hypothetical protein